MSQIVKSREAVAAVVRRELVTIAEDRVSAVTLESETSLGADGLGLDSIEQAELLIACEVCFQMPATELLQHGPLTFGDVVDHFLTAQ